METGFLALDPDSPKEEIATYIGSLVKHYLGSTKRRYKTRVLAFYGSNFTGLPVQMQKRLLSSAQELIKSGAIDTLRLSTRPDFIDTSIVEMLKVYRVTQVEMGVQSMEPKVLEVIQRGHGREPVIQAVKLLKRAGIMLGMHQMLGLPGATAESDQESARSIAALAPGFVRLSPTLVLAGTGLEKMMKKGEYIPLSLEEAVDRASHCLDIYDQAGIRVARLGLDPIFKQGIREDAGQPAFSGPFHPSFRQMVEGKLLLDKIINQLKYFITSNPSKTRVNIKYNPKMETSMRGKGNCNLSKLTQIFPSVVIELVQDKKSPHYQVQIGI